MAISDPTMSVQTPTGVLQGVAAFNWDGAAWQPSGRAGPSVATPTGVLQGVAAFSGIPPQPAGRAGPGVATPTGVLDGVAVYTWSGSQWTPPGGAMSSPTPTGVLRGVAAFDWDGTQWQPAGQAGPDVATPYGVLQGVARFNWAGSAWAATGAPSLSLDFMVPGALDSRITFTRASTATYTDAGGTIQTAAVNAPRWDYASGVLRGLLIEEARTNIALQSGNIGNAVWASTGVSASVPVVTGNQVTAPDGTLTGARIVFGAVSGAGAIGAVNQAITLPAAVVYAFSIWLRGAVGGEQLYIGVSGAGFGSAPRITLTTQWQRFVYISPSLTAAGWFWEFGADLRDVSQTATPAQTIYAWGAQVEQGGFPTSYTPTTAAAVTRATDFARIPTSTWYNAVTGTFSAEIILNGKEAAAFPRILGNDAASQGFLYVDSTFHLGAFDGGTISATTNVLTIGAVSKGVSVTPTGVGTASYVLNGGPVASHAMTLGMGTSLTIRLMGDASPGDTAHGCIRRVQYWPRALSIAEMQAVTT